MRESPWLREIRTLDPERDCRRIVFLDTFYEFPFDTTRALELAFFRTFASPTIADAAGVDRRVHRTRAETLRRHRPADQRVLRGRLGRRARQARAAAHEPDPRSLRDRRTTTRLRPVGDGARADSLERAVRLADAARGRAGRGLRLLARDRPANGDHATSRARSPSSSVSTPTTSARSFAHTEAGRRVAHVATRRVPRVVPVAARGESAPAAISALLDEQVVDVLDLDRPTGLEREGRPGRIAAPRSRRCAAAAADAGLACARRCAGAAIHAATPSRRSAPE